MVYDCYKTPVNRKLTEDGYTDTVGKMIDLPIAREIARFSHQTDAYLRDSWQVARNCLQIDYMPVRMALRIRAIELVIADRTMCDNG